MPPIVVTGRDESITSRHKKHAEDKISKLRRYFNGIVKIEAILNHNNGQKDAEAELIIAVRRGKPLVCHSRSRELYAAIDLVVDKAEVQLTRYKEKLRGRKGAAKGSEPGASSEPVAAEEEEESYQDIVEKRSYP